MRAAFAHVGVAEGVTQGIGPHKTHGRWRTPGCVAHEGRCVIVAGSL